MNMRIFQIITLLIFISSLIFGQNDSRTGLTDDEINELTSRLVMKLLLNDSQKNNIDNLLKTYRHEVEQINSASEEKNNKIREEIIEATNAKIKTQLDSKQKMKYDVLEKDWWDSILKEEKD
jgi:hypothetical protein